MAKHLRLNKRLLNRIKKHILAMPSRLRMDHWIIRGKPGRSVDVSNLWMGSDSEPYTNYGEPDVAEIPKCGTVGCIAGWACLLSDKRPRLENVAERAAELIGVSSGVAEELFLVDDWPYELSLAYESATTQKERATLVAKRIDQFVQEHAD